MIAELTRDLDIMVYRSDLSGFLKNGVINSLAFSGRDERNYLIRCSLTDEELGGGGFRYDRTGSGYDLVLNKMKFLEHVAVVDADSCSDESFAWTRGMSPSAREIDFNRMHFIYEPFDGNNISVRKNPLHVNSSWIGWMEWLSWLKAI